MNSDETIARSVIFLRRVESGMKLFRIKRNPVRAAPNKLGMNAQHSPYGAREDITQNAIPYIACTRTLDINIRLCIAFIIVKTANVGVTAVVFRQPTIRYLFIFLFLLLFFSFFFPRPSVHFERNRGRGCG
jgi:hypothetical protein